MLGDMAVGVWAQLVAGIVYTPIDIVKERLQVPHVQCCGCDVLLCCLSGLVTCPWEMDVL